MRRIGLIAILTLVANLQAAPISCRAEDSDYKVVVSNDRKRATVTLNGEAPPFGHLVCRPLGNEVIPGESFLHCQSPSIADAGFSATFRRGSDFLSSFVKLEEFAFDEIHKRANLPCVHAMN